MKTPIQQCKTSNPARQALRARVWIPAIFVSVASILCACSSTKEIPKEEAFKSDTPFSRVITGSGEAVCWSVKKVFLNQGYILERADTLILNGTKTYQKDDETSVQIRLQTTCVDNKNGTSTVFASASREVSKLQHVKQSVAAGVSIATITVPAGSTLEMQPVSKETIQDPDFYKGFYQLVQTVSDADHSAPREPKASN